MSSAIEDCRNNLAIVDKLPHWNGYYSYCSERRLSLHLSAFFGNVFYTCLYISYMVRTSPRFVAHERLTKMLELLRPHASVFWVRDVWGRAREEALRLKTLGTLEHVERKLWSSCSLTVRYRLSYSSSASTMQLGCVNKSDHVDTVNVLYIDVGSPTIIKDRCHYYR